MEHKREPTLEDLLNEPIIRKVMKRDGTTQEEVRRLMLQASTRLNGPRATVLRSPAAICAYTDAM